jgi:hypothetical protein
MDDLGAGLQYDSSTPRYALVATVRSCCAREARGKTAAAPLRRVMNCRLLMFSRHASDRAFKPRRLIHPAPYGQVA